MGLVSIAHRSNRFALQVGKPTHTYFLALNKLIRKYLTRDDLSRTLSLSPVSARSYHSSLPSLLPSAAPHHYGPPSLAHSVSSHRLRPCFSFVSLSCSSLPFHSWLHVFFPVWPHYTVNLTTPTLDPFHAILFKWVTFLPSSSFQQLSILQSNMQAKPKASNISPHSFGHL